MLPKDDEVKLRISATKHTSKASALSLFEELGIPVGIPSNPTRIDRFLHGTWIEVIVKKYDMEICKHNWRDDYKVTVKPVPITPEIVAAEYTKTFLQKGKQ